MINFNHLLQFLFPLGFLAIWALAWLFNRESQPLPPRGGRPLDPAGPRPPSPPRTPRPANPREPFPPREPTVRWTSPVTETPGARRPPTRLDDDIVILESEPRRPSPPAPRPSTGNVPRRPRPKASATAPKRPEPPPPQRNLSGTATSGLQSKMTLPGDMKPLAMQNTQLTKGEAQNTTLGSAVSPSLGKQEPATDYRALVRSPDRIRETIIMNELLRPPVALRPRRIR